MSSSNTGPAQTCISSLSVPSNVCSITAQAAAAETKRKEEEDRKKKINNLGLRPTRSMARKKHRLWQKRLYFCSMQKGHKDDVYWLKCQDMDCWRFRHVKQHEERHHDGCGENTIDSGAGMQQHKTVAYSAEVHAKFTAELVGLLIRDSLPPG